VVLLRPGPSQAGLFFSPTPTRRHEDFVTVSEAAGPSRTIPTEPNPFSIVQRYFSNGIIFCEIFLPSACTQLHDASTTYTT
jgi:hypothetical protein